MRRLSRVQRPGPVAKAHQRAGPAASEFNPNVSPQMDLILQRMLAKKPEQRHKKIAEFMAEFRNAPLFEEEVTEKVELTEKEQAEKEPSAWESDSTAAPTTCGPNSGRDRRQ